MSVSDAQALGAAPAPAPAKVALSHWVVVAAVGLLTGLQPITTDLYLPALPQLQTALGLSPSAAQWTLSVLILSFGLGQLLWGPVADRWGRQPVLRWGLGLYVLASVLATLAPNFGVMIAARAAQGACLSAAVVCGRAMVRDLYPPEQGARVMARGMSVLGLLALLGPILGGLTATAWGWRATLALLGLAGAAIWAFVWTQVPETLPTHRRTEAPRWQALWGQWWCIAQHPTFRAHALLTSSTYAGLYVYLALSAFVFIDLLGASRTAYGVGMSTLSLAYLVGTVVCRRALSQRGLVRTVRMAGWCSLAGGLCMAAVSLVQVLQATPGWNPPAWSLMPGLWLYAFGHGIHQPCGQTGVVSAFPNQAGAASALSGFVLCSMAFLTGAGLSWWSALPGWANTLHPLTLGMGLGGLCTAWVALVTVQRDGLPPGSERP